MARVTVEDCVLKIPNRFELVLLSSQRAREIGAGAAITVDRDNDKNPVVSLREIADTEISLDGLRDSLIKNHQKVIELEEDEDDIVDMMEGEAEWAAVAKQSVETELADNTIAEDFEASEEETAEEPAAAVVVNDSADFAADEI